MMLMMGEKKYPIFLPLQKAGVLCAVLFIWVAGVGNYEEGQSNHNYVK
jgi:hypothetical protein